MTDNDGFADTPGREATPEEEARVAALLRSLSDDDLPMPDHVWSRLSAVIAEEHVAATARRLSGDPGALADEASADGSSVAPTATVSVLPTAEERRRRGAPRWLLPAAAAAVVVLLGGALVKGIDVGSSTTAGSASLSSAEAVAGGAPAAAPSDDRAPLPTASRESRSGTAYTKDGLAAQAGKLVHQYFLLPLPTGSPVSSAMGTDQGSVSAATPKSAGGSASAPAPTSSGAFSIGDSGTGTTAAGSLLAGTSLAACLTQLTGTTTSGAVAVDRGTFEGKPADVVVVPTDGDPTHLDVWVLAPGCTRTEAQVLSFARIARP